ncbi:MAG: D-aminoacyl-tRNA deacylase [Deltaproteobacteria bacterium]|nr:D-aminoacyl-tRNA deacylase [Deltaproteobacteria bacterium]MDZ4343914.1 D-aminoacyl-tRNA deacylase [Candidatus Binatia bacterium]
MRAVIQRVSEARAVVAGNVAGQVGPGLCVLLGIGKEDTEAIAGRLVHKIKDLRIFEDDQGKMNRSVTDVRGEILVVSQFTLYGDCTRGNRPSFTDAAPASQAERLYGFFVDRLRALGLRVSTGQFQAKMAVSLTNDGPVTFILEA